MASVLKSAYAFYNRQYLARPILTICTTNAFLAGISDTLSQKYLAPSISTSASTSVPTSESTSTAPSPDSSTLSASDKAALIRAAALELAQDVELSWHEPREKDGGGIMHDKIQSDIEQPLDLANVDPDQEMAQKNKQPDSTDTPIEATTSLNYPRMGRFMLYNFSVAPLVHTWYTILDKNFPLVTNNAGTSSNLPTNNIAAQSLRLAHSISPGLKRMVADQALFAPVGLALFFTGLTLLEGGSFQDIKDKLRNTYLPTLKANYMVWPLVQLVNFSVMPLQLRLPFVSVVGIAWNAYLSLANSRGNQNDNQPQSVLDEQQPTLAIVS